MTENGGESSADAPQLVVESPRKDSPEDDVACADCGRYRELVGPVAFDGSVRENGDFVCRRCARNRGVDLEQ